MEKGSIARVLYDFHSELAGELSLFTGDVVQILNKVDKFWVQCSCDGQKGNFPLGSLYEIDIPKGTKHVFAATSNFNGPEAGDLKFNKGDIIIGVHHIDNNWWQGECQGAEGIFPLSHAWKLDMTLIPSSEMNSEESSSSFPTAASTSHNEPENIYCNTIPSYAKALHSFEAQYPNELSIKKDQLVKLIRYVDSNWVEGELDGKHGLIPVPYLEILADVAVAPDSASSQDLPKQVQNKVPLSTDITFPENTFGLVLFDFLSGMKEDLQLKQGDTITLLRQLDGSWYEAKDSLGKVGMCPSKFIEVMDTKPEIKIAGDDNNNTSVASTSNNSQAASKKKDGGDDLPPSYDIAMANFSSNSFSFLHSTKEEDQSPEMGIKKEQLLKLEKCQHKLEEELNNDPRPKLKEELSKQFKVNQDVIDGLKRDIVTMKSKPTTFEPPLPSILREHNLPLDTIQEKQPRNSQRLSQTSMSSSQSSENSDTATAKEDGKKRKMEEQRQCVITELLQTEKDYICNLKICKEEFGDLEEGTKNGVDMLTLFGLLDEVIDVATKLKKKLDTTLEFNEPSHQIIGDCFIEMAEEIKTAYGDYCRNHDDILNLLKEYSENPQTSEYLRKGVERIKNRTQNCFDLGSELIKPVQRLLRYPMLLSELYKCTDASHKDSESLAKAVDLMTKVAEQVNEYKRRKELVFKYRQGSNSSLTSKISKINLHTVKKKSARLGMRLSSTLGLSNSTKDEAFEKLSIEFYSLEKTIKTFLKDLQALNDQMPELSKTCLTLGETIVDVYGEKKDNHLEVDRFRTLHHTILSQYWNEFKTRVSKNVVDILSYLLQVFVSPKHLIEKCKDKKLDYDLMTNKLDKNKDVTKQKMFQDDQQLAKSNYEALNAQLLDELPQLIETASDVLHDSLQAYLQARKTFLARCAHQMLDVMKPHCLQDRIMETFHTQHQQIVERLSMLSLAPKTVFPRQVKMITPTPRYASISGSIQGDQQVSYIKGRYPGRTYQATHSHSSQDATELTVHSGNILGAIEFRDSSGNSNRWYMDNGVQKGFVPSGILEALNPLEPPPPYEFEDRWNPIFTLAEQPVSKSSSTFDSTNSIYGKTQRTSISFPTQSISNPISSTSLLHQSSLVEPSSSSQPPIYASSLKKSSSTAPTNSTAPLYGVVGTPRPTPPLTPRTSSTAGAIPPLYANIEGNSPNSHCYEEIPQDLLQHDEVPYYSKVEFDPLASVEEPPVYDTVEDEDYQTHRYEEIPDPPEQSVEPPPQGNQFYYAHHPFTSTGPNQLSLYAGQVVFVLMSCDLNQNPDWWFVQDRDEHKGYVPSNHLKVYER